MLAAPRRARQRQSSLLPRHPRWPDRDIPVCVASPASPSGPVGPAVEARWCLCARASWDVQRARERSEGRCGVVQMSELVAPGTPSVGQGSVPQFPPRLVPMRRCPPTSELLAAHSGSPVPRHLRNLEGMLQASADGSTQPSATPLALDAFNVQAPPIPCSSALPVGEGLLPETLDPKATRHLVVMGRFPLPTSALRPLLKRQPPCSWRLDRWTMLPLPAALPPAVASFRSSVGPPFPHPFR